MHCEAVAAELILEKGCTVEIVGFGRVLGSLLFVLALFFLFIVLLKRYRNPLTHGNSGKIKLVDQLTLELGRRAVLIEAEGRLSLIVLSKEGAEHIWTRDGGQQTDSIQ